MLEIFFIVSYDYLDQWPCRCINTEAACYVVQLNYASVKCSWCVYEGHTAGRRQRKNSVEKNVIIWKLFTGHMCSWSVFFKSATCNNLLSKCGFYSWLRPWPNAHMGIYYIRISILFSRNCMRCWVHRKCQKHLNLIITGSLVSFLRTAIFVWMKRRRRNEEKRWR